MQLQQLKEHLTTNIQNTSLEFQRLFHGRGGYYGAFEYLTVDSVGSILYVCLYEKVQIEESLIALIQDIFLSSSTHKTYVVQKRYEKNAPCEIKIGTINDEEVLIENGLKYAINFNNQNIGFFADMKIGHDYVYHHAKNKKVLNLFSYTCAFSVCAIEGDASFVVNVDMSKAALSTGRKNHHLNEHDTKKVSFLPHNILKSWNRIKKEGPYDMIVIDPPSFQKGSFAATKDYEKIIKRLKDFAQDECTVLCALNDPKLDSNYMKALFEEHAPEFIFQKRLENASTYPCKNDEESLKSLIFKRKYS